MISRLYPTRTSAAERVAPAIKGTLTDAFTAMGRASRIFAILACPEDYPIMLLVVQNGR
jgi:hypothetical protein